MCVNFNSQVFRFWHGCKYHRKKIKYAHLLRRAMTEYAIYYTDFGWQGQKEITVGLTFLGSSLRRLIYADLQWQIAQIHRYI
jgi:hypothetical protein